MNREEIRAAAMEYVDRELANGTSIARALAMVNFMAGANWALFNTQPIFDKANKADTNKKYESWSSKLNVDLQD